MTRPEQRLGCAFTMILAIWSFGCAGVQPVGLQTPGSSEQPMASFEAPEGVTALSGTVKTLDNHPLSRVTLSIGDRSTQTDSSGRFLLTCV